MVCNTPKAKKKRRRMKLALKSGKSRRMGEMLVQITKNSIASEYLVKKLYLNDAQR